MLAALKVHSGVSDRSSEEKEVTNRCLFTRAQKHKKHGNIKMAIGIRSSDITEYHTIP